MYIHRSEILIHFNTQEICQRISGDKEKYKIDDNVQECGKQGFELMLLYTLSIKEQCGTFPSNNKHRWHQIS